MRVVPKSNAATNELDALPGKVWTEKRTERICRVNDKEEDGETSTMPDGGLHVNLASLADVNIVQVREHLLGAEGLRGADSRDDFFCERTSFRDMLQGQSKKPVKTCRSSKKLNDTYCM